MNVNAQFALCAMDDEAVLRGMRMADAYHSPSFLKKITEMPIRTLSLPSSFVSTHGQLLTSDVILEGPSRKQWKVELDGSFTTFGQGWEEFVAAHVLQLGDQLCFTLTANSHFQVEVYDESGCQKTSALDATDSNTLVSTLFSRRPLELQIPPDLTSKLQNLDDATVKTQLGSGTGSRLSQRESALESIRRDLAVKGNAVRDPYVLPKDGASTMLLQEPESLSDLAECFEDMEKLLAEPPDLTDTEPLVIEDIPPCWELHEHTTSAASSAPPGTIQTPAVSSASPEITKRVSTLISSRPPDLQMSQNSEVKYLDLSQPKRASMRPLALQIPSVLESEAPTPSSTSPGAMRLSQIQNLEDPTLKLENLALYTKSAAEKALRDIQLESEPSSRRESYAI